MSSGEVDPTWYSREPNTHTPFRGNGNSQLKAAVLDWVDRQRGEVVAGSREPSVTSTQVAKEIGHALATLKRKDKRPGRPPHTVDSLLRNERVSLRMLGKAIHYWYQ